MDLRTKGFLPQTLRWRLTVIESDPPHGFSLAASGDFVGRGTWTLRPEVVGPTQRPSTLVTYDWLVLAEKGLLKTLSVVMKPIFSANHHWAMARGTDLGQAAHRRWCRVRLRPPDPRCRSGSTLTLSP